MTKAWEKSYSRVDNSWLILKYKKRDLASLSTTLFVVNNPTAQVIEEKMDRVLDELKCAAKLI